MSLIITSFTSICVYIYIYIYHDLLLPGNGLWDPIFSAAAGLPSSGCLQSFVFLHSSSDIL